MGKCNVFEKYLIAGLMLVTAGTVFAEARPVEKKVETNTYRDVIDLFNTIGYTADNWKKGVREVPRIELTNIPDRWQKEAVHIPVKEKKNIFFRLAGSGILMANERIQKERDRLHDLLESGKAQANEWVRSLAVKYRVIRSESEQLDSNALEILKTRVDIVPPSLALAQAAEESGWGTSRFAVKGNSLFGQWDFSGRGIKPKQQRESLGNYGIASFATPQDSVDAYMLNLNTHRAYNKMRQKRAEMRINNIKPSGWELAKTLDQYSERGDAYIKSLHSIMRFNHLATTDDAYLWDKGVIIVSPVQ
jgi:Bax protein